MEERGIITISAYGEVNIPKNEVWMTMQEISDMLGVMGWRVRKSIEDIYKKGELLESETRKRFYSDDGCFFDAFSLDMVVAVAFRVPSKESFAFREYILDKVQRTKIHRSVILKYDDGVYTHEVG